MMPRSAHVYLFMGKKKFPKFCLCNLNFNHQALWRNKSLILRKHLSQVYLLKVEKSTHQWLGFYLTLRNLSELSGSCVFSLVPSLAMSQ